MRRRRGSPRRPVQVVRSTGQRFPSLNTSPVQYEPSFSRRCCMAANCVSAACRSPIASRASTSSQVSAPVTHGRSSTHLMPRPSTTKSPHRSAIRAVAALTAQRAAEDRVVPVHRVMRLLGERRGMDGDRVAQPAQCELPLGLRLVEHIRQRQRTPDAVENTRAAGQQRLGQRSGRATCPTDFATLELQIQDEVDGGAHRRPHRRRKASIAGDQHVVPDADRDVRAEVAVAVGVFDHARAQLDRPGPVRALLTATPVEGASRRIRSARPR